MSFFIAATHRGFIEAHYDQLLPALRRNAEVRQIDIKNRNRQLLLIFQEKKILLDKFQALSRKTSRLLFVLELTEIILARLY